MARYQLLVDREGRCVLVTDEPLTKDQVEEIGAAFNAWHDADPRKLAVIADAEVIQVTSIELHLEAVAEAAGEGS